MEVLVPQDPIAFPVRGTLLKAQWNRDTLQGVAAQPPPQSQLSALLALSRGDWGGHAYGVWSQARDGIAPLALGGFLRLSGTAPESINGSTVVLGRAVLARRIGSLPMPFGNAIRAGFSAELGNGFASGQGTFYLFLGPIW